MVATPPSFSAHAYFSCFYLQHLVLKISSNSFKFAATLLNLQLLYFICSNFLICSMSLVGHRMLKVDRFSFGDASMAKIYQRLLSTITPQGNDRDSFDPRSENLSGEDSAWMVDRMEIPRDVDCSCFTGLRENVHYDRAKMKIRGT